MICPLCHRKAKRDDRGDDVDGNIQIAYIAALKCDCGLRLEKMCAVEHEADAVLLSAWGSLRAV